MGPGMAGMTAAFDEACGGLAAAAGAGAEARAAVATSRL